MKTNEGKLLGITKAAKILGVHPLTLRSWTEKGYIPYYKTPGGHRRFRERDLMAFLTEMNQGASEPTPEAIARQAVQREITNPSARKAMIARPVRRIEMSEQQRESMRSVGQKLLDLTIQYTSGDADESILEKGREIGRTYGKCSHHNKMSLSETVATFNFFRDTIIETTFDASTDAAGIDASNPQLYHRLNHFFNGVLLATVQAAEEKMVIEGPAD